MDTPCVPGHKKVNNIMTRRTIQLTLSILLLTYFAQPIFPQNSRTNRTTDARMAKATPFKISVPQARLDEIMGRVRTYKFHDAPVGAGWKYGTDQDYLKKLVAHWTTKYDWREEEREINRFQHFRARVDGGAVHFIYEKGSGKNPQPLLLLHGWPYSSVSFLGVIEPLAHPERFGGNAADGFDVIVPDLPGFGYSEAPRELQGLHFFSNRINRLMTDVLGYKKYIVQGGDMGDAVGLWIALDHPENLLGLHENQLALRGADAPFQSGQIAGESTAEERAFMKREQENAGKQFAYFNLHMTRSETLSALAMDSPVGQASWIIEKFYFWSDKTQKPFEQVYSMDHLLTEAMYYLVTDSFHTSIRPYTAFGAMKSEALKIPPPGKKSPCP